MSNQILGIPKVKISLAIYVQLYSMSHWKLHIKNDHHCMVLQKIKYISCNFFRINKRSINQYLSKHDNMSYSSSSKHDQVLSYIEEHHDFDNDVILDETLNKRVGSTYFTETDGMEINLFRLLKVSNKSLILFDRIVAWVKRYTCIPIQNGSSSLMKRDISFRD